MTGERITVAEAQAFAAKLAAFGEQLTVKEQAILREILLQAAAYEEDGTDVQGHSHIADPASLFVAGQAVQHSGVLVHGLHTHMHAIVQHVTASLSMGQGPHVPHPQAPSTKF